MSAAGAAAVLPGGPPAAKPPVWLIACTALLAITILVLAVAETSLRAAYLIDEGEFISLGGLAFISLAGGYLAWQRRLRGSLPLVFPWLLYPVISQGDQIIDNLPIDAMRAICHLLLAAIFATPVAVVVLAVRAAAAPAPGASARPQGWMRAVPGLALIREGRVREGSALLAASLLVMELWLADQYLGTLMIVTLIVMILAVLAYASWPAPSPHASPRSERTAAAVLATGVLVSFGLYYGYKNMPGAYQGSPSFYMDPAKQHMNYQLDRIPVPAGEPRAPAAPGLVADALSANARVLERLLAGYHLLARNYTYDFHNELFLRETPLVPAYRRAGLALVAEAAALRPDAERRTAAARSTLYHDDPLAALLDDVRAYVAFNFDRAPVLEEMSAGFEATPAGLQHAAHLYEGEAKYLGAALNEIVAKHRRVTEAPSLRDVTQQFRASSDAIHALYADRIVGF